MVFKKVIFLLCVPFSFIYFFIVSLRNIFYRLGILRRYKINAKVISVGNITWGGTGKTPVTAFIAGALAGKNQKASILIRGYGNDESELLPKLTLNTPVLVGKDRVALGRYAVEHHLSDTVILDDGFQYRRLARDLDIVCVDAVRPFGNGWAIPAGSLREGLYSLKRADIFLITKADLVSADKLGRLEKKLKKINPKAVIAKAIHRPLYLYKLSNEEKVNIGQLQNGKAALVSAIGSPGCFERTILRLGLKVGKHFIFRDHHGYTEGDIAGIGDYCGKNQIDKIITTEKDAVKLKRLAVSDQWLVLKVRLEIIENEEGFYNRLFGIYDS
ncbi:MAG: tetraacyldisaccharide 4'-kinase [Candidatus Omnitrophota bacterium]|jgi:tetraacyldisaccharide 4'-kinase